VPEHPNRMPFEGVLTIVDEASTRPPAGARGHRVILTRAAALQALPSLLGMGVDFTPGMDGHDARRKCGVITDADLLGKELHVSGYLFAKDFPEVMRRLRTATPGSMGMSYELANAQVEDMHAPVWTLTRATFTGAAVLLRDKAAYQATHFVLSAKRCRSLMAAASVRRPAMRINVGEQAGKEQRWKCMK
jgi:hypothetical protein